DLTDAVQAAVTAGPVPVQVTLRSSVPGVLRLDASLEVLNTYTVAFPEAAVRVVDAPAEGPVELDLPLPADAGSWSIHEVQMLVTAKLPPERVLPPVGPALSTDALLALDPDHGVVVGLPPARTAALAALTAIRVPVTAGADGAELAGTL